MKTNNNTEQVGGTHYNLEIEPVHIMIEHNLNWFQGEILKYVSRHTKKNGKQDLEKAIHICDMYLDLKPKNFSKPITQNNTLVENYVAQFVSEFTGLPNIRVYKYFIEAVRDLINGDIQSCKESIRALKEDFYGD